MQTNPQYPAVISIDPLANQQCVREGMHAERHGNAVPIRVGSPASRSVPSEGLRHSRTGALGSHCSQEVMDRMLLEKAKSGDVTEIQQFVRWGANPNAVD